MKEGNMSSAPVSSDDTAHISPPRLVEAPLDSSAVSTAPSSPPAATDVMRPADANTMPPPPPPLSPLMCDHDLIIAQEGRSSEQPLPSGQGSDTLKPHSIKSAIADKAKSAKVDKGRKAGKVPSQSHPNHEAEVEREDGEWDGDHESVSASSAISCEELPDEQLDLFDWDGLNDRYHKKMKELCAQEQSVMDEFNQLIDYFTIWATVGNDKDVERSYKRVKTQMLYVHHEENQLEQKRQHYIKVVDAFKSALQLLGT